MALMDLVDLTLWVVFQEPSITRCGAVRSVAWDKSWLLNGSLAVRGRGFQWGEDEVDSLILALPVAEIRKLQAESLQMLPAEKLEKDFEKATRSHGKAYWKVFLEEARVAAAFCFQRPLQLPFALAFAAGSQRLSIYASATAVKLLIAKLVAGLIHCCNLFERTVTCGFKNVL